MKLKSFIYKAVKSLGMDYAYLETNFRVKGWLGIKQKDFARLTEFYRHFITPDSVVFDIGSNVGNRADVFLSLGKKVVSLEPNGKLAGILKTRFKARKNFILLNKGCGSKNEVREFHVSANHLLSSFSNEFIDHKSKLSKNIRWSRTTQVEIVTLDQLIQLYGTPAFCKIDVEGFEKEVLEGLSQKAGCLSFEFNSPTFNNETIWCAAHLAKLGYSAFNISFGESLTFEFDHWITLAELTTFIETNKKILVPSYGDIYAR